MAESFIQLAPDSTGKKAHTKQRVIGANTVEDEVVIRGEPYLASYVVTVTGVVALATGNSHLIQLMAGASLNVRIRRIMVDLAVPTTSTALHQFQMWRLSTAGTGGTALTERPLDTADAASGAQAMTLPSTPGTESLQLYTFSRTVVSAAAAGFHGTLFDLEFGKNGTKPLIIPAGTSNGIALKNISTQAAGSVFINIEYTESNFL